MVDVGLQLNTIWLIWLIGHLPCSKFASSPVPLKQIYSQIIIHGFEYLRANLFHQPRKVTSHFATAKFSTPSTSGWILANISLVVLTGFQPIDRDLSARQRVFVPKNMSYARQTYNYFFGKILYKTRDTDQGGLFILFLSERSRLQSLPFTTGEHRFGDSFAYLVQCVFVVLAKIETFPSMGCGGVR